ncbi:MAG TPA: transcription termination/antitermination NusG family protein [Anaerolineales bacterium]|jgi:transcriptional antiterminator RfaH
MATYWYVLHSKPHKEELLAEQLELRRIETFAPHIRVQVVNPRARKVRAYFPGYLFVHVDLEHMGLSALQYVPGSAGLISFGGEPAFVPDGLIHAIRQRVQEIDSAGGELFDVLKPGETVMVHSGPFAGYEAIFDVRLPGTERVRILLKLLRNRTLPVELPAGFVRPGKKS